MLLRHYLEQGRSKEALALELGISRHTIYNWIETGQLDRELDDKAVHYKSRPPIPTKLDPFKPLITERLAEFPDLTAVRLFEEARAAGYEGGYTQLKLYVRQVRPRPPAEPVVRFETAPGQQAQVTRSAVVEGEAAGNPIGFALAADGLGNWSSDGAPVPDVGGALDVDLGFTPATNTLPIRRLDLGVDESASVRSAWLRFPELRLEPLEQTYTREDELAFRYRALVDGEPFIARLDTDVFGRVVRYEGLWEAELAGL